MGLGGSQGGIREESKLPLCPLREVIEKKLSKLIKEKGTDAFKANHHKKIPYLCGSTSEDVGVPVIYSMANKWCSSQEIAFLPFTCANPVTPGKTLTLFL